MVVYNEIVSGYLSLGDVSTFENEPSKSITKVLYNGKPLSITLKDKYVSIDRIARSAYNNDKYQLMFQSKDYTNLIMSVVKALSDKYDLHFADFDSNGKFYLNVDRFVKIENANNKLEHYKISDLEDKKIDALIEIRIPSIYIDNESKKTTLQISASRIIIKEIHDIKDEFVYNLSKLTRAN